MASLLVGSVTLPRSAAARSGRQRHSSIPSPFLSSPVSTINDPQPPPPTHTQPAQRDLEAISEELRVPGSKSLGPISRSVRGAQTAVTTNRDKIVGDFAPGKRAEGEAALAKLETALNEFMAIIEAKDKQVGVWGGRWVAGGGRERAVQQEGIGRD